MVAHFTRRTHGVNQAFRFVEIVWLHRKSHQIRFFFGKRPCLHHTCATWNEQPSNIKTMAQGLKMPPSPPPVLLGLVRRILLQRYSQWWKPAPPSAAGSWWFSVFVFRQVILSYSRRNSNRFYIIIWWITYCFLIISK